jgi:hypothetical protein
MNAREASRISVKSDTSVSMPFSRGRTVRELESPT